MSKILYAFLEYSLLRACVSEVREAFDLTVTHYETLQDHIEMNKCAAEQLYAQFMGWV